VAELADALRSGRSELTLMRVQVPPSAPKPAENAGVFIDSMPMSPRLKKILKVVLVISFLVAFFFYVPIQQLYRAILSANSFLFIIAALLGFPGIFLTTLGTWILARRQEIQLQLRDFYLFNLVIRFYGFFSPASAVATMMRWHKMSTGNKGAEALSVIAVTRMLSIVVAICMGLFWAVSSVYRNLINPFVFIFFLILVVFGWLLITRISPILANAFHRLSHVSTYVWMKKFAGFMGKFFESIRIYSNLPASVLVFVASLNLANEILGIFSHVLMAGALQIPLSITDLGWLRAISFLAALAPLTLAGGIGLREVSLVIILSAFDISPELAAAYSFLIYARGAVFSLLCGLIELFLLVRSR
jgi:uncharacterized membrane protein YbhN (UPF0104 family)